MNSVCYDGSRSVREHITRMRHIANKLNELKINIANTNLVYTVNKGLKSIKIGKKLDNGGIKIRPLLKWLGMEGWTLTCPPANFSP